MFEIIQSDEFKVWHDGLRDKITRARVSARIRLAEQGSLGDWKSLRDGVSEMRIDVGPGYRLYFIRRGNTVVVLLCGGDKRKQDADIERAINLAKRWKE
ncbi:MAG: type II toxin-antitoxin system RelE/ParE family toxin [Gallionella sp.]